MRKQFAENFDGFNDDGQKDCLALPRKAWEREKTLTIFDELHRMKQWNNG
ncbi:MAG: hypothetical protein ACX932_05340 [Gammaproteobacteria bacterium]